MKQDGLKGKITISRVRGGGSTEDGPIQITIQDEDALIEFVQINVSLADFTEAVTGLAYTPCAFSVRGLDKVGKKREHRTFEFPLPDGSFNHKKTACEVLPTVCPEGWTARDLFNSQDSFFQKDGKVWARTLIMRWVDKT